MKNVSNYQEMMIMQHGIYIYIYYLDHKNIINSFTWICKDKKIQVFLNKLFIQENETNMMI